ncbi:FAD/NAD(P)-binding domain-containing protein [Pholiota conissans]|uniref:FAD/NAD(P)-binding domain-containing protein n=1 Tax=Pholiota conissans TaxID=109636 RepID=A0A9P5Z6D3_9AGAR|nr:FAD/NAD(P)-binding domain-containing protein [Pholiota conissans]
MVNLARFLPFLSSGLPSQEPLYSEKNGILPAPSKSVAVVGAGSAGLAMLKTLLDLPTQTREGWEIVLYEERENVAGVWLPDPRNVTPPEIPETPLYPLLHTNTPVPFMSYPGFPFPPKTPLYPSHEHIEAYHLRYAQHYSLLDHISFNHKLQKASWSGTPEKGHWDLVISDQISGRIIKRRVDHLVIGSGNHHLPRIPKWKGQEEWLNSTPPKRLQRRIIHSVYYRQPQAFTNQRVLVVGNGASGRDAASQVIHFAREVISSVRHEVIDPVDGVTYKPEITEFTSKGVVFTDGTTADPDVILLGTGYELRKPFLEAGGELRADPSARDNSSVHKELVTNLYYIFPLHKHILSLSPSYPINALAFIGLPTYIPNCPSDIAQSLFATHAIFNPSIFPPREELLEELAAYDEHLRSLGLDPYTNGHRMLENDGPSDYQDELVDFLKAKGVIHDDGKKFVESWRRDIYTYQALKRGWKRIEELGTGEKWTEGIETEAQWADLMRRVNEWQERREEEQGIHVVRKNDLAN